MTTQEALEQQTKRSQEQLQTISNIVDILTNWELSLQDIIANEEQLDNAMSELKETMNEIIKLRQWLDFENIDNRLF